MTLLPESPKNLRTTILMYHEVSEVAERTKKLRTTSPEYSLSREQFREQMLCLHANSYQTFLLDQLLDQTTHNHHKSVYMTFDDGWAGLYRNVFPILNHFRFTATIFVIPQFIGQPRYLHWNQLREMNMEGMSIQSHTMSHRPLTFLKASEIKSELEESKRTIEDNLGAVVDFLSVPHGMIDRRVVDIARSIDYKAICTSEPGFSHTYGNPAILKRINISYHYNISTFRKILDQKLLSILPAVFSKKTKNLIKKLLGYDNYRKLYNLRYRIRTN